ncbi:MAG: chromosomal replication initiator protein DnaA [Clostridia bacterium]|nr:chromosomal replication initiator protein DnaA [Clostridia bacterium]
MFPTYDADAILKGICDTIRDTDALSSTALEYWFKKLSIILIDEEASFIVFSTDLEMKKKTLFKHYSDNIAEAIEAVLGKPYEFDIVVEEDPNREPLEGEGRVISPVEMAKHLEEDEPEREMTRPGGEKRLSYNSEYTFENFIVGGSNKFAHAASYAVATHPACEYNPLLIYGPSGLGKTHLMYAITNKLLERNPEMNAIYVGGEDFANQLIESIKRQTNYTFREKYRKADILLIDDIQFIAGKEATQEEFFHTFNALYQDKKQIILTSDRPPKEMVTLEERIRTRLEQGLIVDIHLPDYELRLAILKNKAEIMNLTIGDEMLAYIAEKLQSNIRQLEGIIKRISAMHLLEGAAINMDMIRSLVPMFQQETEPVTETAGKIIEAVAKRYRVTPADILGTKRNKNIKDARNISMYVIRQVTGMSLNSIGKMFSRDHSTAHSNITVIEKLVAADPVFASEIEDIRREIKR